MNRSNNKRRKGNSTVCPHCQKLQNLYPERGYDPKHLKKDCPILTKTECFNCKKTGHTPKYCKEPKIKCTRCYKWGHMKDDCPILESIKNPRARNVPIVVSEPIVEAVEIPEQTEPELEQVEEMVTFEESTRWKDLNLCMDYSIPLEI